MAEKETSKEKAPEHESKKPIDNRSEKVGTEKPEETAVKRTPPWPLITIGIFAAVVTIALITSWVLFATHRQPRGLAEYGHMSTDKGERFYHRGGGMRGGYLQAAAARGVVTAVNGDTITVSGSGKQVAVTKSSSTAISGDKTSIAVNDTVIVYGTTADDDNVTATRILVRNERPEDRATIEDSIDSSSNSTVPGA